MRRPGISTPRPSVANWAPTITSSNLLTDANGGMGARRTCDHISGAAIEEVITEWEEGEYYSYEMTTSLGPVKTLPFPSCKS